MTSPSTPARRPTEFDLRRVTLRAPHEGDLPSHREFGGVQWKFLLGSLDPNPAAFATVCLWNVESARWLLPPEYIAEYRRQTQGDRSRLLAVAYRYSGAVEEAIDREFEEPENHTERRVVDFAWRLERHWLVEWDDRPSGTPRPPVTLVTNLHPPFLIGTDLPPRLRPSQAVLTEFPLVTADEIALGYHALGMAAPTASDLSRALAYYESVGVIHDAPDDLVEAYRERRALGTRPLRVYLSMPYQAQFWFGKHVTSGVQRPWTNGWTTSEECAKNPDWNPSDSERTAPAVYRWLEFAEALHARGLRTV